MAACAQVISTALGYVLPNLISRKATQHAASVLYTFFGLRLLWIAWHAKPQETNQARGRPRTTRQHSTCLHARIVCCV